MLSSQDVAAKDFDHIFLNDFFKICNRQCLQAKSDGVEPGAIVIIKEKFDSHSDIQKLGIEKVVNNPIQEKIYLDIMKYFASAPNAYLDFLFKNELSDICTLFEYKKNKDLISFQGESDENKYTLKQLIDRDIKTSPKFNYRHIVLFSQLLDDYVDLNECSVIDIDDREISFTEFVNKYKNPPDCIIHPKYKNELLPLHGLMSVAACALMTGDIDWLGGTAKNTGVYITYNAFGERIAKAINVDAGFAVNSNNSLIEKDIQFASMGDGSKFLISLLSNHHYDEFMQSLYMIVYRHQLDALLKYLIMRNHTYEQLGLGMEESICILSKIQNNVDNIKKLYKSELNEYYKNNSTKIDSLLIEIEKQDSAFIQKAHLSIHKIPEISSTALQFFSGADENEANYLTRAASNFISKFFK